MKRRRPFNREIIGSNIAEAIEELQTLERKASAGDLSEEQLQVGLQHAYHHLNFAWNVLRVSTSEYAQLTQHNLKKWGKYPADIAL